MDCVPVEYSTLIIVWPCTTLVHQCSQCIGFNSVHWSGYNSNILCWSKRFCQCSALYLQCSTLYLPPVNVVHWKLDELTVALFNCQCSQQVHSTSMYNLHWWTVHYIDINVRRTWLTGTTTWVKAIGSKVLLNDFMFHYVPSPGETLDSPTKTQNVLKPISRPKAKPTVTAIPDIRSRFCFDFTTVNNVNFVRTRVLSCHCCSVLC